LRAVLDQTAQRRQIRSQDGIDSGFRPGEKSVDALGDAQALKIERAVGRQMRREKDIADGGAGA